MDHRGILWPRLALPIAAAAAIACSSAKPAAPPKETAAPGAESRTATGSPAPPPAPAAQPELPTGYVHPVPMSKINPDVVEETPAYYVTRYKKSQMEKVDDGHVRFPYSKATSPIYREDADYYYIRTEKVSQEEIAAKREEKVAAAEKKQEQQHSELEAAARANPLIVTPEQFETLVPKRGRSGVRFERAGAGLPTGGQWRQNFAIADMDGDGHPDVVAPPARFGEERFHVFLGDGKGGFHDLPVKLLQPGGKTPWKGKLDYGGVAVADFDGDGKLDVAVASHQQTVRIFRNLGDGRFEAWGKGLPPSYSSQALAAFDVNGDGRPDLVVSRDIVDDKLRRETGKDFFQVREFINEGNGKWRNEPTAIQGACFSFNVFAIDLGRSGTPRDLLTGCRYLGGWGLTWINDGKGKFTEDLFKNIEQMAYHSAVAPGTFGPGRVPAFADLYQKQTGSYKASGLNVYHKDAEGWHTTPVWREKSFGGRLTSVGFGDLNGDGLDDLIFPDRKDGKIRVFYQMRDGTFEEAPEDREPPLDSPVQDIRLVDLDGDGRLDLVMAKTTFSEAPKDPGGYEVLLNRGE